jgi:hypothetical protein
MTPRFDRTLRIVMWLDALFSFALAALCLVASPIIAVLGLPRPVLTGVGAASMACGAFLAACGAVTAVALMLRLRDGVYRLPDGLRLPLPAAMRPPLADPRCGPVPRADVVRQDLRGGRVR